MNPAAFVLNIGTNDIKDPRKARPREVADGVTTSVVAQLEATWPRAKVVVLALLPRAPREFPITSTSEAWDEGNAYYRHIKEINARLEEAAARDPRVTYLDCSPGLLSANGGVGQRGTFVPHSMLLMAHRHPLRRAHSMTKPRS